MNVRVYERKRKRKRSATIQGDGKANSVVSAQMVIGRQKGTSCVFSTEDDNNKRLRSASSKLERENAFFYNRPLIHAIFQYPASFFHRSGLWITLAHFHRSQTRTGIICNAGDEFFPEFLARLSAR